MPIEIRPAYYAECDLCGVTLGPYANIYAAEFDGWLITDKEVRCYACQDGEKVSGEED